MIPIVLPKQRPKRKRRLWIPALVVLALLALGLAVLHRGRGPTASLERVEAPAGSQLLLFPMEHGVITAGYRNPAYLEKNGYPHYGTDIASSHGGRADVLASGEGVVLGTEFRDNSLGNIAVVRYDNVYIPQTGETTSLIARYYHMTGISIAKDDRLVPGQVIGAIDGRHKWWHHIHIELDRDLDYPFHTPQVAEASSELLRRFPATGEGMVEPLAVLAAAKDQRIRIHPLSDCCEDKDNPRYAAR